MRHLSITYQDGLTQRARSLREHMVGQVYGLGLVDVAGKIDLSPSKLSEKLAGADSGGKPRALTIDELERYIKETGDVSPIHYLIERFMTNPEVAQGEALAALAQFAKQIPALCQAAGIKWPP